jgi:nicotinamidase-related amidase
MTTQAPPALDPRHTALLVMDYQTGVFSLISDADTLLARVADVIETVRALDGRVCYVRLAFEAADYAVIPRTSRFAAIVSAAGRAYDTDSPATAIHDRVAPRSGDIVLRKVFPRQAHIATVAELPGLFRQDR